MMSTQCNGAVHDSLRVSIIGAGYVGLVTAVGLAELGWDVSCFDCEIKKIDSLNQGCVPFYEQHLQELLHKNTAKKAAQNNHNATSAMPRASLRVHDEECVAPSCLHKDEHQSHDYGQEHTQRGSLTFYHTDDIEGHSALRDSDIIFIAVGTPSLPDGRSNMTFVWSAADWCALHGGENVVCIVKSTVPLGTYEELEQYLCSKGRSDIRLVSNPEFLREGTALQDFFHPDRIVLGGNDRDALDICVKLYGWFERQGVRFIRTNATSSELIKYASNAFLAAKITFINEIAALCEVVGADVMAVKKGVGCDKRIGESFLEPGPGYGGSCFPKDTRSLAVLARTKDCPLSLVEATIQSNNSRQSTIAGKILVRAQEFNPQPIIAFWGLTFKAHTDDVRDSAAMNIITLIIKQGVCVRLYDPCGLENARQSLKHMGDLCAWTSSPQEACKGADILVIATEWPMFIAQDFEAIHALMRHRVVFDLRNILVNQSMTAKGFEYRGIGRNANP